MDAIKWLTMYNNFVIDYAKTLYMPEPPEHAEKKLKMYAKSKVPYFFIYAKDKEVKNVEPINNSTVNRLHEIIPNKRVNFTRVAGKFDYRKLMKNKNIELDEEIINTYEQLVKNKKRLIDDTDKEEYESYEIPYVYKRIREELLKINSDEQYVTDVLVKYLYRKRNANKKRILWGSFGDVILENIKYNLDGTKQCEMCGKRIESYNTKKYCNKCWEEIRKQQNREKALRYYYKKKNKKIIFYQNQKHQISRVTRD